MSTSHSHLMKVTRRGRPFVKDIQDLFCTLLVSLQLDTHRSFFKQYPNSFNTDEAAANLASLKFSQSHRAADPKDPARIITTTTTTTFSMTREMARGICQHFMDAHLIENAADLTSPSFKERGIYMVTPKGTHMLERFITKNGISATHIAHIFAEQPIHVKMLHLERRSSDDEIIISKSVIEVIWRRVAGAQPNMTKLTDDELQQQLLSRWFNKPVKLEELNVEDGLVVRKVQKDDKKGDEFHFTALGLTNWLTEFTSCGGLDEAAELSAHLVRYGLISLVHDLGKVKDHNMVLSVKAGGAGGGAGAMMQEGEYRATDKAVYRITKEGMQVARWIDSAKPTLSNISKPNLHAQSQSQVQVHETPKRPTTASNPSDDHFNPTTQAMDEKNHHLDHAKDSHTGRLKMILDEPAVRSLFREYLRANFCEENLSFWLDVQDFKRKFGTTSSAQAAIQSNAKNRGTGVQAMERHQADLIAMAFVIYNITSGKSTGPIGPHSTTPTLTSVGAKNTAYLAPASPCELNIDHNLRAELISHMQTVNEKDSKNAGSDGQAPFQATQVQTTMKLYERIQGYIFRLMATDSVPRFCKTERFLSVMRTLYNLPDGDVEDINKRVASQVLDDDQPNKSYLTISQAANEKLAAAERFKNTQYS